MTTIMDNVSAFSVIFIHLITCQWMLYLSDVTLWYVIPIDIVDAVLS